MPLLFARDIAPTISRLSQSYSAIMLTGPRQVGKTTVLTQLKEADRTYVTLDDWTERNLARTDPRMFLELHRAPVMIDEAQYAPELFSYIKMQIDQNAEPGAFWLTGSQAFSMMRLAQESLAGRAALLHMPALSQHEIYSANSCLRTFSLELNALQEAQKIGKPADIMDLYTRIWQGSMPAFVSGRHPDRDVFYSSFLQTYVARDLTELSGNVDRYRFVDFIRAAACRCGCLLNIAAIAQDVGVSPATAKHWLGILEQSDLIFFLHPYANNLLKRTVKAPKLYFFDTGLVAYLTRHNNPETLANGALCGQILENYVVNQIRASFHNAGRECPLWYYRDFDQDEIDLLLEADGVLHPIEIKRMTTPNLSMTKTFKKLKNKNLPIGTGAVICNAPQLSALQSDVFIVPVWML